MPSSSSGEYYLYITLDGITNRFRVISSRGGSTDTYLYLNNYYNAYQGTTGSDVLAINNKVGLTSSYTSRNLRGINFQVNNENTFNITMTSDQSYIWMSLYPYDVTNKIYTNKIKFKDLKVSFSSKTESARCQCKVIYSVFYNNTINIDETMTYETINK